MKFVHLVAWFALALLTTTSRADDISAAHRAAVLRLFKAYHLNEFYKLGVEKKLQAAKAKGDLNPRDEAFYREIFDTVQLDEVQEKVLPVYAKYLSESDTRKIASFWESSAGQKLLRVMLEDVRTGRQSTTRWTSLLPAEKITVDTFLRSPAGKRFIEVKPKITQEGSAVADKFGEELSVVKFKRVLNLKLEELEARDQHGQAFASPTISSLSPGFVEQLANIIATKIHDGRNIVRRFRQDTSDIKNLLAPQNLSSLDSIQEGRKKTERLSKAVDRFLAESHDLDNRVYHRIRAIELPQYLKDAFLDGIERGLANGYDEDIRFGENQRHLIALIHRIQDFAESRLGKFSLRDGVLNFNDPADLDIYNDLIAQLKEEGLREQEMLNKSADRSSNTLTPPTQ